MARPTGPSFSQALFALLGRRLRWIPLVLGIVGFLWFTGPALFSGPPPHHGDHFGLPGPPSHPHRPPLRIKPSNPDSVWPKRATKVKEAFVHAYSGYRRYAFEADELKPVSGKKHNNFNGWGISMYDGLDSMWIMGLKEYFEEALKLVQERDFTKMKASEYAPFFETVIRYLGGLLSAYALSGEQILLTRADELGRALLPAFNTTSGLPMYAVNTQSGKTKMGWTDATLWAEALSCQMEYKYLAHLTGNHEYYEKVEQIMNLMYNSNSTAVQLGLFPTHWSRHTGMPSGEHFSVGAFSDSALEYLLKQWLLTGRSENKIKDLYLKAAKSVIDHLLYLTPDRELLYVTDSEVRPLSPTTTTEEGIDLSKLDASSFSHNPSHTFEHLSCFLPGLFALGAHTLDLSSADKELHEWAAAGLGYTCWLTYADQATGLGPDEMSMKHWLNDEDGLWINHLEKWKAGGKRPRRPPGLREGPNEKQKEYRDYLFSKSTYLLRPETIESFYILWRTTGDDVWRKRGWAVFQSIEQHTKTEYGYASVTDVDSEDMETPLKDEMPSYFLAETLKYLYLLFTDEEIIPLSQFVFNTEAHPLPIFEWSKEEKEAYNIPL
ncbi:hypothetical protein D9758_006055 [Tetrapyrgos nigripes]|uniref:alpha-1,2-Mannosidase n=1 Tax=Tetrapyrgos nigripes TaxID=182062 RepID=A0A8H5G036_9AGAR|nr:hypothetical protein D9758_006055 [Tetrapyrgos nigripes]